jgi:putative transposase
VCSQRLVVRQAFQFQLDPNQKQRVLLAKSVGCSRFVYNWGLAESQRRYELTGKRPPLGDLKAALVTLKKTDASWLYEVSAHIGQSALRDLNIAFERFFRGLEGEGPATGFPRFKRKGKRDSARLYEVTLEERHIRLPMIGRVRLKETRKRRGFDGRILSATITRRADRWFVALAVQRERDIVLPKAVSKPSQIVGVDLGLKTAAVIDDGSTTRVVEPQQALRMKLRKLGRLNRQLARKQKRSHNREKAKLELARLHYKIACQRKNFLHQLSASLTKTKSVIVVEDLHVSGMKRNKSLALSIGDAGFGELRRQLEYKSTWYGSTIVVADRWFPSSKTCSACGCVKKSLTLADRVFECETCGLSLDRDENAARNLRRLGLTQLPEGPGEVTPLERGALASAPAVAKPTSVKQEATADGDRRPPRRSTSKDVPVSV